MKKLLLAMLPIVTFVGSQSMPAYAGEVKLTNKVCNIYLDGKLWMQDVSMGNAKIVDGVLYFNNMIATNYRLACNN